jgi:hypothetical protein
LQFNVLAIQLLVYAFKFLFQAGDQSSQMTVVRTGFPLPVRRTQTGPARASLPSPNCSQAPSIP